MKITWKRMRSQATFLKDDKYQYVLQYDRNNVIEKIDDVVERD